MKDFRKKTASGFAYKFAERVGAQGINFAISMILARILLVEEYGAIALVTVFIAICDVFVTYGFGNSLIVNKNSDSLDFSTCFYCGIGLAAVVYSLVFFAAPFIADFYDNEILTPVLRVMALRIPIAAVNSVQHAYVAKHMIFKKFFYATLVGTVISGIIAVIMAYHGFGVWALVEQYLGNVLLDTVCLWFIVGWRPKREFSFARLKMIYSYGWKILVVGLIDTTYREVRSLVIGKQYTKADLAFYNKGVQFPVFSNKLIEPTINTVLFPALSHCNDNKEKMLNLTRRMLKLSTFVLAPVMVGLAAVAQPLIVVILTKKWLPAVIYLQIGCVAYLFRSLSTINNSVVRASGNSALLLKLDVIKKIIGVVLLAVSMFYGVEWIAISYAVTQIISAMINISPNRKILGYGYQAQLMDVAPNFLLAFVMGAIVWLITLLNLKPIILLPVQVVTGIIVYVGLAALFKYESLPYLYKMIRQYFKPIRKKRTAIRKNDEGRDWNDHEGESAGDPQNRETDQESGDRS